MSVFGNCIWDGYPGGAVSGFSFFQSLIHTLSLYLLLCTPFLIGLFGSLESNFLSSLYILDIIPLSDVGLVKIFSQFVVAVLTY